MGCDRERPSSSCATPSTRKDDAAAAKLLAEIPAMRHNTGTVEHKLSRLKARPK